MRKLKSPRNFLPLFVFTAGAIFPSGLFALKPADVSLRASDIIRAGCRPQAKRVSVSPGTAEMFRYEFETALPAPRSRHAVTAACKEGVATAYYFQYSNNKQARKAFVFARKKIWNGYSRSAEKPERLYLFNNYFMIISSADAPHTLDQLLVKKVGTAPVDDETLWKIMKRLKCGKVSTYYETCKVLRLFRGSSAVNFQAPGFRYGRVREFGASGRSRFLYKIGYVSEDGKSRRGFVSPVNAENPGEEKELRELHENLKAGRPAAPSAEFRKFLDQSRDKMSRPVRSRSADHILEGIRIVFHVRNVRGKFVILATTEHITGRPSGMIVGILRPMR